MCGVFGDHLIAGRNAINRPGSTHATLLPVLATADRQLNSIPSQGYPPTMYTVARSTMRQHMLPIESCGLCRYMYIISLHPSA